MTHAEEKLQKRVYDDEFIARCKDLAVLGLQPSQIAERLGLQGTERRDFIFDCTDRLHTLHQLVFAAYQHSEDDIQAALTTTACSGDVLALDLAYRVRERAELDDLKKKLFGI